MKLKKKLSVMTSISFCFCLFGCSSDTVLNDTSFEDISFKVNSDYIIKENEDHGVEDIFNTKSILILLNEKENTHIQIKCTEYYDGRDSETIIKKRSEIRNSDPPTYIDSKSVSVNSIIMQYEKYVYTRGIDPLSCDYSEYYYFTYKGKLYELNAGSSDTVNKDDFTDSYQKEQFEAKQYKMLNEIVNTIELN